MGGGGLGHRVELGAFQVEVLAVVLDDLAGEELADDLDRLGQHFQARHRLGPVVAGDVLVERLARASPR